MRLVILASAFLFVSANSSIRASLPFYQCFEDAAREFSIDADWLTAISIVESSLNPKAVSGSDAIGLMQIKWPITARHLGAKSRESLFSPCFNIRLGGKYLRELLEKYDEDRDLAASAYRVGPTGLMRSKKTPKVVIDYLKKIDSQLEIFATQKKSKTPTLEVEPVSPIFIKDSRSDVRDSRSAVEKTPAKKTKNDSPSKEPNDSTLASCDIGALQVKTLSTHNPAERESNFLIWLEENLRQCDVKTLTKIRNQIAIWLGTGDTKKVREKIASGLKSKY